MILMLILFSILISSMTMIDLSSYKGPILALLIIVLIALVVLVILRFLITLIIAGIIIGIIVVLLILIFGGIPFLFNI